MDKKQFRLGSGGGTPGRSNRFKNAGFIALVVLFGMVVYAAFNQPSQLKKVPFSQVVVRQTPAEFLRLMSIMTN